MEAGCRSLAPEGEAQAWEPLRAAAAAAAAAAAGEELLGGRRR